MIVPGGSKSSIMKGSRLSAVPFFNMESPLVVKEICKKQLFTLIDKVEKVKLNDSQIDEFLPAINKKLDWLSRELLK